MKIFYEFLGFIVLTGPLFIILLWVPVSITLAYLVSRKVVGKSTSLKILGGLLVFLIAVLLPISDEIAGRIYFNEICKTEGDVKVYQTIVLPAEYWNEDGSPTFYDYTNGNFTLPSNEFYKVRSEKINRKFGVQEQHKYIIDINTDKVIGESSWFLYWGGFIRKNFTPHNNANSCGDDWNEFVSKQFVKQAAK